MNKEFNEIIISVKRAISLLRKDEKKYLLLATAIMLITGILTNLPAVILGRLVDSLVGGQSIHFDNVAPFIFSIIVIILIRECLTVLRKYLIESIATRTDKEQTIKVIERLLKTDITKFLYKNQIGSLHGRIFRSLQGLIKVIKLVFLDFTPIFFTALAAIGIALLQKPIIASLMILVIPTGMYIITKQVSSQKGIRISLIRGKEQIDGRVVEMLSGIETIRALNTAPQEIKKVEDVAERLRSIEIRHHVYMALFDAAKYLNEGFFYILVIVLSIFFASKGVISKGDILVYSILFTSIVGPLREIHRILDQAHEGSIQVNDLYELLHEPLDQSFTNAINDGVDLHDKNAVIRTSHLSFDYEDKDALGTLNDINIKINKGEWIGIAGASGCGKTTFVHIILKLIHGYRGEFYLFGKKLSHISRKEISDKIAYVPQKPFIFSGTIKDNILYGSSPNTTDEEMIIAAKKAKIFDEIEHKLGGFNGTVSESGNNLSGGQRQRLALARVMLQSPELIILDEATSALDNSNEAIIQKNIEKTFKGKTMIVIAHRLTTLKSCDRIFVFDKGKIVQEGGFKELSTTEGPFKNFIHQKITQ